MPDPASLLSLQGRVAIVTGGASGIGLAAAELMADAGARVAILDLNAERLERLPAGRGFRAHAIDVTDAAALAGAIDSVAAAEGRVDILVNNAGVSARRPTEELPLEDWRRVLEVNLTAAFVACRAVAPAMLPRRAGAIINIASMFGLVGNPLYGNLAYHASKGGLVNLTRALAVEWGGRGIRVNAVAPTFVETDLTRSLLADRAVAAKIAESTPLGRVATAGEVAAAILFLASDMASMITGHVLPVDGGWLAR